MANPISPKVTATAVAGVLAAAVLPYITPDLFAGLGKFSGLVYGLVIAVIVTVAGYVKNDPLRATEPATPAVDSVKAAAFDQIINPTVTPDTAPEVVTPVYTQP